MAESHSILIPPCVKDLAGRRFGRLLVVRYAGVNKSHHVHWLCKCDCGAEHTVQGCHLTTGHTKSCGCLGREASGRRRLTHGKSATPEYHAWVSMLGRCLNTNNPKYAHYGGRGITVCERWRHSFADFFADMGSRPSLDHSLDRVNNDGNYEKSNCRWASRKQQSRNSRHNRLLTFNGQTKPMAAWAEEYGIDQDILGARLKAGWSVERAITERVHGNDNPTI